MADDKTWVTIPEGSEPESQEAPQGAPPRLVIERLYSISLTQAEAQWLANEMLETPVRDLRDFVFATRILNKAEWAMQTAEKDEAP